MQKLEAAPLVKKVFGGFCKALFSSLLEDEPLKLGDDRSKKYARSLLESKENASIFTSAFGGAKIKIRIENILSFKKLPGFLSLLTAIFCVLVTNAG